MDTSSDVNPDTNLNVDTGMETDMDTIEPRQLAPGIEAYPRIVGGKPVIAGTRMSVEVILEFLAGGDGFDELLDAYPFLTREDISAALAYAAQLASHPVVANEPAITNEPAAP